MHQQGLTSHLSRDWTDQINLSGWKGGGLRLLVIRELMLIIKIMIIIIIIIIIIIMIY